MLHEGSLQCAPEKLIAGVSEHCVLHPKLPRGARFSFTETTDFVVLVVSCLAPAGIAKDVCAARLFCCRSNDARQLGWPPNSGCHAACGLADFSRSAAPSYQLLKPCNGAKAGASINQSLLRTLHSNALLTGRT
ncbi:hypothetical protein MRX96_023327 [Rhipicephalus microplus]